MNTNIHIWPYLPRFFLEWEMFWSKVVEKFKTHILHSITFFFINRANYETMWKKVIVEDRPQMTVWSMRIACWITKAIWTHSEYVILIAFLLQQLLHKRTSMLRYTYFACLVLFLTVTSFMFKTQTHLASEFRSYEINTRKLTNNIN